MTTDLSTLSAEDEAARERLYAGAAEMLDRTKRWSAQNTGSLNTEGLRRFAPQLAEAFSALEADIQLTDGPGFESVGSDGRISEAHSGPIIEISARMDAPIQIVMSGHYDTVFAPGVFETVTDLPDGRV
ncbi:MAG: hypothetical protein ACK4OL_12325, partial [Hyphomonas sp.]